MEKIQVHEFQRRSGDERNNELSTDHNPPSLLERFSSHCNEVTCPIEDMVTRSTMVEK